MMFRRMKICSQHDLCFLKAACSSCSLFSMVSGNLSRRMLLKTFAGTDNRVIPLQLLQSAKLPFLGSLTMTPFRQSSGTCCCFQQQFKRFVNALIVSRPPCFISSAVMRSAPAALLFFNLSRLF